MTRLYGLGAIAMIFVIPAAGGGADESTPRVASFGSWRSPISAEMLVEATIRIGDLSVDGDTLYWVESRPSEAGRNVIAHQTANGDVEDVLPDPFSARTLAHEYGGGAMLASGGTVYFSNFADQRVWKVIPGQAPSPVTGEGPLRFADFRHDAGRNRLISVCEDHASGGEPENRIVAIDLAQGTVGDLVTGSDFYSSPRLSPDGKRLAWLSWNHPNMPWDGTDLWEAAIQDDGRLAEARLVAGGREESIFQPEWAPDGSLFFVSDRTNWWNLYRDHHGAVTAVTTTDSEFGAPQWLFGMTTYDFDTHGNVVTRFTKDGRWRLATVSAEDSTLSPIALPFSNVFSVHVGESKCFAELGSSTEPDMLAEIDVATRSWRPIRTTSPTRPDPGYTSIPETIEFPTDGGRSAHAFYYPPTNKDFRGPDGDAPPLLIIIHGGPTSQTSAQYRLSTQYWTSRGFAICDVNYGGSTGYGREYRNRLRGNWGIVDVADATNAALFLASQGKANAKQLIIRGGSAGGYTTLACLAFRDVFCCGASYYGVSDLALLARDTHKFESRYLDRMVGPYPAAADLYKERSPIEHMDRFNSPIILFQGLEDKVVPPNQAEEILASLKERGVPVAYVPFAGEQHGFRKSENIIRAHEAELYFYAKILGISLPDTIEPVEIFNFAE